MPFLHWGVRHIKLLIDSNRNNIDFARLFPDDYVTTLKCGTTDIARTELERGFRNQPTDIVFHTGTNDIETTDPRVTAENIMNNAEE